MMKPIRVLITILLSLAFLPTPVAFAQSQGPNGKSPTMLGEAAFFDQKSIARAAALSADASNYTNCGGVNVDAINSDFEQQVIELVNTIRADNALPPLKLSPELLNVTRYHAADMSQDNYFKHDSYDLVSGQLQMVCITWDRIKNYYHEPMPLALAENIAAGYASPAEVVNGWMESTGHRANILSTDVTEMGVGYFQGGGEFSTYWVQDFGRRNGVYPLVINREAAKTNTRQVSLYLYGQWQEMRLRNDSGAWTDWSPFQSNVQWNLDGSAGEHTVSAEVRSGSQGASSSDTIILSETGASASLGGLPKTLDFTYSIPEQRLIPESIQLHPVNQSGGAALNWQVSVQGTWINVSPNQGSTPGVLTVAPLQFDSKKPASYEGSITVTATNPQNTTSSPQTINVRLNVVNSKLNQFFLPQIVKVTP